ncbi:alpha/beta-hydrolase [Daedaleopsis nitida]|nr:alpha/beta-hydrolase [Daedaleopsis nitida]
MEISYGENAYHRFDYYPAAGHAHTAPLVVFVHGGAWRSEDKADHAQLARSLVGLTHCPVAVPNYRLTTPQDPVEHPAHASDVLRFLHFLSSWSGPHAPEPCSAHILGSILLASPFDALAPSPQLLAATRAVVLSEGIYDIDLLLRSFPSYKQWFIANAFGERASYPDVNVASYALRPGAAHIRWLVLHSSGDVLVDQLQSDAIYAHLSTLAGPLASKNFDDLKDGHNELLKGSVYPRIVADLVAALTSDTALATQSNA